jgi:secondary thiamine-phosphate synthase enzyme
MVTQVQIMLPEHPRGAHLITTLIEEKLTELPEIGLINIFIQHTSAALTINENFDPSVRVDLNAFLNKIAPEGKSLYTHDDEGLDDMPAHIKSTLAGSSISIPISNHRLNLGTWQGIYLLEFRNHGGNRRIIATIMS